MHTPRRSSSMDQCVDKMTSSPTNDTGFEKHPGVSCLKPGKWVAKIRHPVSKVWVCVGIYNTPEEAADACTRKNIEYESNSEADASFHTDVTDLEKHPGIMRMESGKWRAVITHKKDKVSLGTYDTPSEAMDAYNMSKLERDSKKPVCSIKAAEKRPPTDSVKHPLHPGVSCPKPGKWVAKICHPIRNVWVCVGIYSTPEEAGDAYTKKKVEYESHSVQETAPSHTNVADFETPLGVNRMTSGKWRAVIKHNKVKVSLGTYDTANEAADAYYMSKLELGPEKPRHAYQKRSGRWHSEIRNPLAKGKRVHLGTFDTAEEAVEAYNKKRREFDLMFPVHKKHKELNNSCKTATIVEGKSDSTSVSGGPSIFTRVHLETFTGKAEEGEETYNKMCEVDLMVDDHMKKDKQSNNSCKGKSDTTCVFGGSSVSTRVHMKTFSEEAEEAYNNAMHEFDLMVCAPKKCEQLKASCEADAIVVEGKNEEAYNNKMCEFDLMVCADKKRKLSKASCEADPIVEGKSDSIRVYFGTFSEEAEEAYNKTMCEFDLMVHADKKHKQSNAYNDPFVSINGGSVVDAGREEETWGSLTNVNVESVPLFVTEKRVEFDLGIIDSYGRLLGEYSSLDDELWMCRSEDDATL